MLDTRRVRRRVREIRKRLLYLEKDLKPVPKGEFIKDEALNAVAERNLQVAIQACIDIANHIVSALGLELPKEDTAEVFDALSKESIIPESFLPTVKDMVGYRNIVVHDYLDIDRNITYDNIQNHLPDLSKFAQYIEKFLEKQKRK